MVREAVTQIRQDRAFGVVAARIGLVVSGLVCLVLTPPLALAYQRAYGAGQGETVDGWIKQVEWPTWVAGLDAVSTYNRYGVMFGIALAVVVVCLAVVVRSRTGKGKWERRGWWLTVGGLGAVAAGSLSEYGIPEDLFDSSSGFALSMLGFLLIMIGTPVLAWAVRREVGVRLFKAIGIALIGPLGVIFGTAVNGHLPGGPATPLIITAMIIGITGLPDTARP
jgi:uncharacterized membrane protein